MGYLMAGAIVTKQIVQLGRLDKVSVHLVPGSFDRGTPLFGDFDSRHTSLEFGKSLGVFK